MINRENPGKRQKTQVGKRKHRLGNRWETEKMGETDKTQVGNRKNRCETEKRGVKQRNYR